MAIRSKCNLILTTAATAALILGPSVGMAQAPGGERSGERGAGGAPGGMSPGGRGAERGGEGMQRGGAEHPRGAPGAEKGTAPEKGAASEKAPASEKTAPKSESKPERAESGAQKGAADRDKKDERGGPGAEKREGNRAGEMKGGHGSISGEQRTRFKSVIRERHVESIHSPGFAVRAGTIIPERYHFYPLPPELIEIVPDYRGYDYIVVDDEIIILEPGTRRIVDVIEQ